MTPPEHPSARALFLEAVGLSPEEQTAFLDRACAGDPSLRAEIEGLLAFDTEDDRFLETPAAASGFPAPSEPAIPESVGGFTVLDRLGEGGSGIVLLAEQRDPARRVALKILRTGAWSGSLLRRFRFESEVLARLAHPGIASVYASGVDESGPAPMPFIAMELVDGAPLTEHADMHRLGARERVGLLRDVCDAVAHAHARGVIHRDLKPSNILIGSQGTPKVLDFGVARVIEPGDPAEARTQATMTGQIIGTLAYMSPEQLAAKPGAIDTRTDVFALGVILYELLTGELPHRHTTIAEAAASLPTAPVPRLSDRDRSLRGDLDAIARKAIDPDPERRYTGAAELAADLGRYLDREPVAARLPTLRYQFISFARRHRGLVAASAAGLAVLVGALVLSVNGLVQARAAAIESSAAVETVEAVNSFLIDMLDQAHPDVARGRTVSVPDMVETAARQLRETPAGDASTDAALRITIAETLNALGRYEEAAVFLDEAIATLNSGTHIGEGLRTRLSDAAVSTLAAVRIETGEFDLAEDLIERLRGQTASPELRVMADRMNATVALRRGEVERAEQLYREAVASASGSLGAEHAESIKTEQALATLLYDNAGVAEAAEIGERVSGQLAAKIGEDHPLTLQANHTLASTLHRAGEPDAAIALYRAAIEARVRVLGPDHPRTLESRNNLAILLRERGDYDESRVLHESILATQRRVLPEDHIETLSTMNNLALLYKDLGRLDDAESMQRDAKRGLETTVGSQHPLTLTIMNNMGITLRRQGKSAEAAAAYAELLAVVEPMLGDQHPTTHAVIHNLGGALFESNEYQAALGHFERAVALAESQGDGYPPSSLGMFLRSLGSCQAKVGDRELGIRTLERAEALLTDALGESSPATRIAQERLEELRRAETPGAQP